MEDCQGLTETLIGYKIRDYLLEFNCIQDISHNDHVLHSTPVHVNKYINIKPLIEKYKKEIEKYVFPSGRELVFKDAEARKLIRSVQKMKIINSNSFQLIDL